MSNWPPSLKEFVRTVFQDCPEYAPNRPQVEAELKEVISHAHSTKTLWEMKWEEVKLPSLSGKPPVITAIPVNGKRKKNPLYHTATTAANKKNQAEEEDRRLKRLKRFESGTDENGNGAGGGKMDVDMDVEYQKNIPDWDHHTIIGRSRKIEKSFYRLTSEPNPNDVRPLEVLVQTLEHLKTKWRNENNYIWICDQFKSLRQDLTVQRIKNKFTAQVYEIHARIALEKGDLGEFNQCASQLLQLYKQGIPSNYVDEFTAYRVLYLIYSRDHSELARLLGTITPEQRKNPLVDHALKVRFAVSTSNYRNLFKLFSQAPGLTGYLMDAFVARERIKALATMSSAFHHLSFSFIRQLLAFDTEEECQEFLKLHDALYSIEGSPDTWDAKASKPNLTLAKMQSQKVDLKGQL